MDAALRLKKDWQTDVLLNGTDLATDNSLTTSVVLSLMLDAYVQGQSDHRGWWADALSEVPVGSKLWLLKREKQTANVLAAAQNYAEDALEWMLRDGLCHQVQVAASWQGRGRLLLNVSMTLPDGSPFAVVMPYDLETPYAI